MKLNAKPSGDPMYLIALSGRPNNPLAAQQPACPRPGKLASLARIGALFCSLLFSHWCSAAEPAGTATPGTLDMPAADTPAAPQSGDESPMMLYLVPWNANPESGKNGKKFTLYQPWGSHFDPLTPVQTQQLNGQ